VRGAALTDLPWDLLHLPPLVPHKAAPPDYLSDCVTLRENANAPVLCCVIGFIVCLLNKGYNTNSVCWSTRLNVVMHRSTL